MPSSKKPTAAIILGKGNEDKIYPKHIRQEIDALCQVTVSDCTPSEIPDRAEQLSETRFLYSGWGAPRLDAETLAYFPKLEAVFYSSGTIKDVVTDTFWERNIPICSAWAANAVPVAEFAFAQIILALKQVHRLPAMMRQARSKTWPTGFAEGGSFGTTVGLVSLGQIGRRVAKMLGQLDVKVIAYDPVCPATTAEELSIELVSLEALFARSRVVSLHAPDLPVTEGMITGSLIESLPQGGALINTASGALIRENELIDVLQRRQDLSALLDVVDPEPAPSESLLYDLPNIYLTPHIAGSQGSECGRMGQYMVDECRRYLAGAPLHWQITREQFAHLA